MMPGTLAALAGLAIAAWFIIRGLRHPTRKPGVYDDGVLIVDPTGADLFLPACPGWTRHDMIQTAAEIASL